MAQTVNAPANADAAMQALVTDINAAILNLQRQIDAIQASLNKIKAALAGS